MSKADSEIECSLTLIANEITEAAFQKSVGENNNAPGSIKCIYSPTN